MPAFAQTIESDRPQVRLVMTDEPITIDGVPDEAVWLRAEPVTAFVQQEPNVDQPSRQPTEVRILGGADALYFAIRCTDSRPVTARERRRDNAMADDDRFEIVLDTFHDHRNGYHFAINPLATQYDALSTDEGRDINAEWDERWWSAAHITNDGWTAEIKIPYSTLRSAEGLSTFGINFLRFTRSTNERVLWSGWNRDFNFLQVSQAGHLEGVETIRTGLRLRVKPYVLGGARGNSSGTNRVTALGLESVKASITPAWTAEFTANTDFAQTEVDEAVVNLTRFPVFFPEKREFFLERAGVFEFGLGGRRGGQAERNLQMYFSRKIGIADNREPVPIIAGAKVIGRSAGFDVGILNVQTDETARVDASNYTVVRVKRNLLARSNVGLFASNRQGGEPVSFNRVAGADATFAVTRNTDVQGFLAGSWTDGRAGDAVAGRAKYNWFTDKYEVFAEHLYIGPDFQHDVGYVRRPDISRSNAAAIWQPRPGVLNIRNLVFRGELVYLTDTRGRLIGREQIFQSSSRWQTDDVVRFNTTQTFDRLDQPFEIANGVVLPPGDYSYREQFVEGEGGGKRMLSGRVRYSAGSFYSGHRQAIRLTPVFKPHDTLSFDASYEWNDVSLPEGAFTTHVINARANITPTNKWIGTALAQYDTASKRRVIFARLNYIYRPGDDVYFIVNRTDDKNGRPGEYTVLAKFTYSFDF
ncbi:MAG TPA: DUF5916 domain-containing protein [Vicinamibacterales bacterium]